MPDQQPSWPIGVPLPPAKWSWEHFWEVWMSTTVRQLDLGWLNTVVESVVPHIVAAVAGTWLRTRASTAKVLGAALDEVAREADPILIEMAAAGLSDYFGTQITGAALRGGGAGSDRKALFKSLSGLVFTELFGAFGSAGPVTPAQGKANAERVIAYNLSTALEGWMEGLIGPGFLEDWIPGYNELDDVVSANLGLGRISRRVLTPLINTLIIEPFSQHLNQIYRPTIYSDSQAVRALNRGAITEPEYFDVMGRRGWSHEAAADLRVTLGTLPTIEQARDLLDMGVITDNDVYALIGAHGYDTTAANRIFSLVKWDWTLAHKKAVLELATQMFVAREMTPPEFLSYLDVYKVTGPQRDAVLQLAGMRRSRPQRLPRGTMEDAFGEGIVALPELAAFYEQEGYDVRARDILVGLVTKRKAAALEKAREQQVAKEARAHKPLPRAAAQDLHRRGLITTPKLAELLQLTGLAGEPLQLAVVLAEQRRRDFVAALARAAAANAPQAAPRSAEEDAFIRGHIEAGVLLTYYLNAGYEASSAALLVQLAVDDRAAYQAQQTAAAKRVTAAERAAAERAAAELARKIAREAAEQKRSHRDLDRGTALELHRRGLITTAQLSQLLTPLGIQGAPLALVVTLAESKRQDYIAAEASAAAATEPSAAPRSAEEEAHMRGLISDAALRGYYDDAGFDAEAAGLLMELAAAARREYVEREAANAAAAAARTTKATL